MITTALAIVLLLFGLGERLYASGEGENLSEESQMAEVPIEEEVSDGAGDEPGVLFAAQIFRGEKWVEYTTLQQAMDDAREGECIVLLSNIVCTEVLTNGNSNAFSMDFAGYQISFLENAFFENRGKIIELLDSTWTVGVKDYRGGMVKLVVQEEVSSETESVEEEQLQPAEVQEQQEESEHLKETEEELQNLQDAMIVNYGELQKISNGTYITYTRNILTYVDSMTDNELTIDGGQFVSTAEESILFTGISSIKIKQGLFIAEQGILVENAECVSVFGGELLVKDFCSYTNKDSFVEQEIQEKPEIEVIPEFIVTPNTLSDPNETESPGPTESPESTESSESSESPESSEKTETIVDPDATETPEIVEETKPSEESQDSVIMKYRIVAAKNSFNFASFEEAWNKAVEIANAGLEGTITIGALDNNYLDCEIGCELLPLKNGNISISGMNMQRGEGFLDAIFVIDGGKLSLIDVKLDGMSKLAATGSLIQVKSGALVLHGTNQGSTQLCNNRAKGILVENDGKIVLGGNVFVRNNMSTNGKTCNLFLSDKASLIVDEAIPNNCLIGITHQTNIIYGYTELGAFSDSYKESIGGVNNVTEQLKCFKADFEIEDGTSEFYLVWIEKSNSIIWEKDVALLPESGILKLEFILLGVGLLLVVFGGVKMIRTKNKLSAAISICSSVVLAIGCGLFLYHEILNRVVDIKGKEIVSTIQKQQEEMDEHKNVGVSTQAFATPTQKIEDLESQIVAQETSKEGESEILTPLLMPIDGRDYIGIVEISSRNISLPIAAEYSDADMKNTPCLYYGSVDLDNLVIVGHNYDSQFGKLNYMKAGEQVSIQLVDGRRFDYQVIAIEVLTPEDVDKMIEGDWDMTLFTCNYVGDKRVAVRCKYVE